MGIVIGIVWNVILLFVVIILILLILDEIGFFEWVVLYMVWLVKGNGVCMFILIVILGVIVVVFFVNDGVVLILMLIVLVMVWVLYFDEKKVFLFIIVSGFIVDVILLLLVVSNLVNIVFVDFFGIIFFEYVLRMWIFDFFLLIVSISILYLYFCKVLFKYYDVD